LKRFRLGSVIAVALVAAGCADDMTIRPNLTGLELPAGATPIPKKVGLYMFPPDLNKVVMTPGGGTDMVAYRPYADLELGLNEVLRNTFEDVATLSVPYDPQYMARNDLSLTAIFDITTTSSSDSKIWWMPTSFTVTLSCTFTDAAGRKVTTISATGIGHAQHHGPDTDNSLAGQLASRHALENFQAAVLQSKELRE
jgi:hypothetical protein